MFKLEDKKIIFNSNFNFDDLEYLNCGCNAVVYKLKVGNNDYALKIFYNTNHWKLEKFEKKLDLNISSFISPIKISYLDNKFNGYLMKLCRGNNLLEQNLDISIGDFIINSDKLFYDTAILSDAKYLMQDINKKNVMYDNGFKIIDIDFYEYCPDYFFNNLIKDKKAIKKYNKKNVTQMLIDIFIWNAKINYLFEQDNELEQLKNDCIMGKISLNDFFYILCTLVCCDEEYKNISIQDVGKKLIRNFK